MLSAGLWDIIRLLAILVRPSVQLPGESLKLRYALFLPHTLQFIINKSHLHYKLNYSLNY
jgi:hypothetical protein